MLPARYRTGLLVLVGLLLLTNPSWMYPHAGDLRYTYERTQIGIDNGTLTYHGRTGTLFGGEYSDLNALGCQPTDTDGRACGFDRYLVTHGPVTTAKQRGHARTPEFVRLDGDYYRRTHRHNESTSTYDVQRVTPRALLAAVAINLTGAGPDDVEDLSLDHRLAVSGGTLTSFEEPEDDELGRVYRRNGTYYTVVVTDQVIADPPIPLSAGVRRLLQGLGVLALLAATVHGTRQTTWLTDRRHE